jgi:hypothetical protein
MVIISKFSLNLLRLNYELNMIIISFLKFIVIYSIYIFDREKKSLNKNIY